MSFGGYHERVQRWKRFAIAQDTETIWTTQLAAHIGQRVQLAGWVHQVRALGGISFLILRDGWGTAQAVTEEPARLAALDGLQAETVIALTGLVVAEPQAPGGVELHEPAGGGDHAGDRGTAVPDE